MNEKPLTFWGTLIYFIVSIPISILQAYVLVRCWGWFVVTAFALRPMTLIQALGLILTVSIFQMNAGIISGTNISTNEKAFGYTIAKILVCLIVLASGYVYTLFM